MTVRTALRFTTVCEDDSGYTFYNENNKIQKGDITFEAHHNSIAITSFLICAICIT